MNVSGLNLPSGTGLLRNGRKAWFVKLWSYDLGTHAVWSELPLAWIENARFETELHRAANQFRQVVEAEIVYAANHPSGAPE